MATVSVWIAHLPGLVLRATSVVASARTTALSSTRKPWRNRAHVSAWSHGSVRHVSSAVFPATLLLRVLSPPTPTAVATVSTTGRAGSVTTVHSTGTFCTVVASMRTAPRRVRSLGPASCVKSAKFPARTAGLGWDQLTQTLIDANASVSLDLRGHGVTSVSKRHVVHTPHGPANPLSTTIATAAKLEPARTWPLGTTDGATHAT